MKKSFLLLDQHFNVTVLYLLFTLTSLESHVNIEVTALRFDEIPPDIKSLVEKIDKLGKLGQGNLEMSIIKAKLAKPGDLINTLEGYANKIENPDLLFQIKKFIKNSEDLVNSSENKKNQGITEVFSFTFGGDNGGNNGGNKDYSFCFIGAVVKKYLHEGKEVVDYYISHYDRTATITKTSIFWAKFLAFPAILFRNAAFVATGGAAAVGAVAEVARELVGPAGVFLMDASYGDYDHQKEILKLHTNLRDIVLASFIHKMIKLGYITVKSDDKISLN